MLSPTTRGDVPIVLLGGFTPYMKCRKKFTVSLIYGDGSNIVTTQ